MSETILIYDIWVQEFQILNYCTQIESQNLKKKKILPPWDLFIFSRLLQLHRWASSVKCRYLTAAAPLVEPFNLNVPSVRLNLKLVVLLKENVGNAPLIRMWRDRIKYLVSAEPVVCVTDWMTVEAFVPPPPPLFLPVSPRPPSLPVSPPRCCWFTVLTHHSSALQIPQNLGTCQNLSASLWPPQTRWAEFNRGSLISNPIQILRAVGLDDLAAAQEDPATLKSNKSLRLDHLPKMFKIKWYFHLLL